MNFPFNIYKVEQSTTHLYDDRGPRQIKSDYYFYSYSSVQNFIEKYNNNPYWIDENGCVEYIAKDSPYVASFTVSIITIKE